MELKYVERGCKENLVLIPGWATDYRIFNCLDLPYNYLLPVSFSPFNFAQELHEALEKDCLGKVSIFGWSMGGFLAADFCARYPGSVNELILLGMCKKYKQEALREINIKLVKNKKAWLYKFYQGLFAQKEAQGFRWFKGELLKGYTESIGLEDLALGLEYLSRVELDARVFLGVKKIKIFHGTEDSVVPLAEAEELVFCLPQAEFIRLPYAGHACFFSPAFKESFSHE